MLSALRQSLPGTMRGPLCAALLSLVALTGCASKTSVSSTWHDADKRGARYDSVLIIALANDGDKRLSFEDSLAQKLASGGTRAVPSSRVMDTRLEVNRENLGPTLTETGAQAVILTQVSNFEVKPVEIDSYTDITPRRQKGSPITYDYVEKKLPSLVTTEFTTKLTTEVYDADTDSHVYTMVSSATGQETLSDVINVLSDLIARRLKSDRVVQ